MKKNERKLLLLAGALFVAVLLVRVAPVVGAYYDQQREEVALLEERLDRYRDLIADTGRWIEREQARRAEVAQLEDWVFSGSPGLVGASVQRELRRIAGEAGLQVRETPPPRPGRIDGWVVYQQEMSFLIEQDKILKFLNLLEQSRPRLFVTEFNITQSRRTYTGSLTVTGFSREI
jgi:hypothetical protein